MIDIIIPSYNSEEFITNTLDSLANQTIIDKCQITIIDDHSKRKLFYLTSSYPNLNLNIIRNKRNKGEGPSRQVGIYNTHNKYILFIDSDDILTKNTAIEKLYNKMLSDDNLKVVMGKEYKKNKGSYYHEGHVVGKLLKREVIDKYKIKFTNMGMQDDVAFTFSYLSMIKLNEVATIRDIVYEYCDVNPNAVSKKYIDYDYKEVLKATDYAYKYVTKYQKYDYFKIRIYKIFQFLSHKYYTEVGHNSKISEQYIINALKFIKKYKDYLGNLPEIGKFKYNDEEYDLVMHFWKVIMEYKR